MHLSQGARCQLGTSLMFSRRASRNVGGRRRLGAPDMAGRDSKPAVVGDGGSEQLDAAGNESESAGTTHTHTLSLSSPMWLPILVESIIIYDRQDDRQDLNVNTCNLCLQEETDRTPQRSAPAKAALL